MHCRGCRRGLGLEQVVGGTIPLGSHWIVNHYQDEKERFLGWLIMQPIKHRMLSSEMTEEELQGFGVVANRLENALKKVHNAMRPSDQIEIVYLVRLGESTLAKPAEWHLHCHMVPRTSSMRKRCEGWDIQKCRERGVRSAPTKGEIEELMKGIKNQLELSN